MSGQNLSPFLQINLLKLNGSFEDNIYNFSKREANDQQNNVYYNQLVKKLVAAIEHTHCEGFLAFQDDIPKFAEAFEKASSYSIWRSMNNRFLFAYIKKEQKEEEEHLKKDYFKSSLFKNHFNILVIEANFANASTFHLKANKFVGPSSEHPEQLIHLSTFYALNQTFIPAVDLFPAEKLNDLQGREIVVGVFDYRPFMAVDFQRLPLYYDQAADNPSHLVHVDGTEVRFCHIFCELYNCTVQFDTTEKEEWGLAFSNYSGYGLIGMIINSTIQMALGGMYAVHSDYAAIDMTVYLGRSGVTCLVPTASAVVSWYLPLRPFQFTLWLAILICLSLETLVLLATRKFEHNMANHPTTWWACFEFGSTTTLKLFINQSSQYLVQSHTARIFLIACYIFDIIMSSSYGGGLSSVLTLPIFGEMADSVEKLVKFNLTWSGSSYAWVESIKETEGNENIIYQRLFNNFQLSTMDEMRSKAKFSNMAFVFERLAFGHFAGIDFVTPEALQRLKLMVDDIYSQFTVAMVSRLWPHLDKYNNLMLQWHSSGLDQFWEWKITADYLNVNEQNQMEASKYNNFDRGPTKLNIQNFAGLMVLWIIGMIVSIGTFGMEIVWFKFKKSNKEQRKETVITKTN